jgi:hypothetical protein
VSRGKGREKGRPESVRRDRERDRVVFPKGDGGKEERNDWSKKQAMVLRAQVKRTMAASHDTTDRQMKLFPVFSLHHGPPHPLV